MKQRAIKSIIKSMKWLGLSLLFVVLILTAALTALATSKTALHWAWTTASDYLPQGIHIDAVEGRLIGQLQVRGVKVDLENMRLRLDYLGLQWAPAELLDGTVHIKNLTLKGLDYTALPSDTPPEPSEPFTLPKSIDLPVTVVLDGLNIENVKIRTMPKAEPILIERARLAAILDGKNWRINELSGSGPLFQIEGSARLTPRGRYANQAQIAWRLNPPDFAPVQGKTQLRGTLDKLLIQQSVAAPYNVDAQATVKHVLTAPQLKVTLKLAGTDVAAIGKDLPVATVNAHATAEGTLDDLQFKLQSQATDPRQGTARLTLDGRYTGQAVQIKNLRLNSPDTPGQLQAHGSIALAADNNMNLMLKWQKLQWPLAGPPQYVSPQGEFHLQGPLNNYRLEGGLRWRLASLEQAGQLTLDGHGDLQSFVLKSLALRGAPGTLNANANVVWAPKLKVSARVDGDHLNPGAIAPGWPGDFNLQLRASAQQRDDGLHAQIKQLSANGSLRRQPLDLDAAARYGPAGAVIEKLKLLAGKTRLTASGQVTEPMKLKFALDSDDLGTTVPDAKGQIHARGTAAGAYRKPEAVATLSARNLGYAGNHIGQLALDADIDVTAGRQSRLTLSAGKGEFGSIELHKLSLNASGRPQDHAIALAVDSNQGTLNLNLDGDFKQAKGLWKFTMTQARLAYPQLAPWQLAAPAHGQVSASAQSLGQACWTTTGDARLCLQGRHDDKASQAQFTLNDFAYAYIKPLLPETMQLSGGLSAKGKARLPTGGSPAIELSVRTQAGALAVKKLKSKKVHVLAFEPGKIDAKLGAKGSLNAHVDLPLANGGLRLNAQIPEGSNALSTRPLSGDLSIKLETLDFLPKLTPEVTRVVGSMNGQLNLAGSLAAPSVQGRLALDTSELVLGTPGLDIRDLSLALVGRGREVGIEMRAKSGGGTLAADGNLALTDSGQNLDLTVTGDMFQALNDANARVYVSPDLKIAVTDKRIDVNGSLAVPKADITPRDLPAAGGITVSNDQVIVHDGGGPTAKKNIGGRKLHARVRVTVGDPDLRITESAKRGRNFADTVRRLPGENKVRFEGFGMKAILAGSLLVVQEPDKPAIGSGELRIVVGQYKAYGQDLNIEDGEVLFGGGPVTEPALNISAVRRPREDVLVGVRVRGRVDEPSFTLYSDPSNMTQSEQLSWLVLGRPLTGASSSETSLVTKAALALGIKGGNTITSRLQGKIGVDELGIESDDSTGTEQAALVVGKYLTPKLYVSYGVGLFDPVSTLRLRYTLSRLFRVETQSSATATGGDLIYSIERGGK